MKEERSKEIRWKEVVASKPDRYGNIYYDCTCNCGYISRLHKSDYSRRTFERCGSCTREARAFKGNNNTCWPYSHELSRIWFHLLKKQRRILSDRWLDFDNFIEDIGPRLYGLIIQRINASELLSKDNWEWSAKVRAKNSKRYKLNGINYTVGDYKLYQVVEAARKLVKDGIEISSAAQQAASSFGGNQKEIEFHLKRISNLPQSQENLTIELINHTPNEDSMNWIRFKNQQPREGQEIFICDADCSKISRITYQPEAPQKHWPALGGSSLLQAAEVVWWAPAALSISQRAELELEKKCSALEIKLNQALSKIETLQETINKYEAIAREFRTLTI